MSPTLDSSLLGVEKRIRELAQELGSRLEEANLKVKWRLGERIWEETVLTLDLSLPQNPKTRF